MSMPLARCSSSFCSLVMVSAVAATSVGPSSSPSPSSAPPPPPPPAPPVVLLTPRPPPSLTPLTAVAARPPATEGVCSRALSAFGLRPRFFLGGPAALTWLPLTRLMASTSTEGERASSGVPASSGGKDVCRSGWADPAAELIDMTEGLRRFRAGPPLPLPLPLPLPSAVRFLFVIVLMGGSCECEGCGGERALGEYA